MNTYYADTWMNDIALVRLSTRLPVGAQHRFIEQVNLPSPRLGGSQEHATRWPSVGQRCVIAGWGCTYPGKACHAY